jgi:hypothetical protein
MGPIASRGRPAFWCGCAITVVASVAMGAYFADVGLDRATAMAGVLGAFFGLAGLAVAVWGAITAGGPRPPARPGNPASATAVGVTNTINSSTINGTAIQGGQIGSVSGSKEQ